jgi:hypothetical protein
MMGGCFYRTIESIDDLEDYNFHLASFDHNKLKSMKGASIQEEHKTFYKHAEKLIEVEKK